MNSVLWWIVQNTATIALAIILVALVCRLVHRRPALHHLLWLMVMLKFLTPPVVVWPWSIDALAQRWREREAPGNSLAVEPVRLDPVADPPTPADPLVHLPVGRGVVVEADAAIESPGRFDIDFAAVPRATPLDHTDESAAGDVPSRFERAAEPLGGGLNWHWVNPTLSIIWAAGTLLTMVWQGLRLTRFHYLARQSCPAPRPLADEVQAMAARLRMRPPPARVSNNIATPLVWSLVRLVLLWPARLAGDVADHRGVIAHELAHVKRRDHWTAWLVLAVGCVWWWNPLYWLVRRRLHETAEMACDAMALELSPEARGRYAELLLEWSQWSPHATPAPAVLGASFGARRTFRRRLAMILNDRISSKLSWPGLALAGLLALIWLPAWSWGQATEPPTENRATTAPDDPAAVDARKPAADTAAEPRATTPRPDAVSLAERLRQMNAAGKALDEERASRKADEKIDIHQVTKELQQARRDLRLIRTGGPVDAAKLAQAQRALARLRAWMRDRKQTPESLVTETYLHVLGRRPSQTEAKDFQKQLAARPDSDRVYDDVFWALLNSKEFWQPEAAERQEKEAADRPADPAKALHDDVAVLLARLKEQEEKLRVMEKERAELLDQLKLLTLRVHELQDPKTRSDRSTPGSTEPGPASTTPRPTDDPSSSKPGPSGPRHPPAPARSSANTRSAPTGANPFAPSTPPGANTLLPDAIDPAAATGSRPPSAASSGGRTTADGAVDVINLATAYIDAQGAYDLAKARAERAEKLRNKGYASQEQIETDLLTVSTAERKLKLLRAIVEAEVLAAKAELDWVDRAIAEGVLPKSKRISLEARLRVLGLIVEPAQKTK